VEASIRPIEIKFSWKTLYAHDRDIHEATSPRLFFVAKPTEITLSCDHPLVGHAPVHPDRPELGLREVALPEGEDGLYRAVVPLEDLSKLSAAGRFRLKDLANFELSGPREARFIGDDLSILKQGVPIVHWTTPEGLPTVVHRPDGGQDEGISEPSVVEYDDTFVQFERYGFTRIEVDDEKGSVTAFFAYR
jgi:glutamyl-tRNA synthetase